MDNEGRKVVVCDNGTGVSTAETPPTRGLEFNKKTLR